MLQDSGSLRRPKLVPTITKVQPGKAAQQDTPPRQNADNDSAGPAAKRQKPSPAAASEPAADQAIAQGSTPPVASPVPAAEGALAGLLGDTLSSAVCGRGLAWPQHIGACTSGHMSYPLEVDRPPCLSSNSDSNITSSCRLLRQIVLCLPGGYDSDGSSAEGGSTD